MRRRVASIALVVVAHHEAVLGLAKGVLFVLHGTATSRLRVVYISLHIVKRAEIRVPLIIHHLTDVHLAWSGDRTLDQVVGLPDYMRGKVLLVADRLALTLLISSASLRLIPLIVVREDCGRIARPLNYLIDMLVENGRLVVAHDLIGEVLHCRLLQILRLLVVDAVAECLLVPLRVTGTALLRSDKLRLLLLPLPVVDRSTV